MTNTTASLAILSLSLGVDRTRVEKMLSHEATASFVNAIVSPESVSTMNQKGAMRFVEGCAFAVSGEAKMYDKGTAMLIAAIALTQQSRLVFSDLQFLMGAHKDGASLIAGVSRAKMMRHIGSVGTVGTITSKLSRTVSKRGIFSILGISTKGDEHSVTLTSEAKTHPFVTAYAHRMQQITDGDLQLINEGKRL